MKINKKKLQKELQKIKDFYLDDKNHIDATDKFFNETFGKDFNKLKKKIYKSATKSKTNEDFYKSLEGIDKDVDKLFKVNSTLSEAYFIKSMKDYYSKRSYAIASETDIATNVLKKQSDLIKITESQFKNATFSERIWKNQQQLKIELAEVLNKDINNQRGRRQIYRDLARRLAVSEYKAERVVRTELARYQSEMELEQYKDAGVEEFEFVAVLDNRTSSECKDNDGEVHLVKDMSIGTNAPPLHPNCRSTTVPYFQGMPTLDRIGRDPRTGKSEYMDQSIKTYKDYENKYIKWL